MTERKIDMVSFEHAINDKIPIPKRWKEHILKVFKTQVNNIEELEYLPDLLRSWAWITRDQPAMWATITYLNRFPATTPFLMAISYIFDEGIESEETSDKDIRRFAARFRRAIYYLHNCGIITAITLKPEEVGVGKTAPTIWISPFAKQKDIDKTREFYINMGGRRGTRSKKKSKTPKEVAEYNAKVQAYTLLNKYTTNSQTYDYYQCPKKHLEGLKRTRKAKYQAEKRYRRFTCPGCNRELIEIPFREFMDIKENQILKERGISK